MIMTTLSATAIKKINAAIDTELAKVEAQSGAAELGKLGAYCHAAIAGKIAGNAEACELVCTARLDKENAARAKKNLPALNKSRKAEWSRAMVFAADYKLVVELATYRAAKLRAATGKAVNLHNAANSTFAMIRKAAAANEPKPTKASVDLAVKATVDKAAASEAAKKVREAKLEAMTPEARAANGIAVDAALATIKGLLDTLAMASYTNIDAARLAVAGIAAPVVVEPVVEAVAPADLSEALKDALGSMSTDDMANMLAAIVKK